MVAAELLARASAVGNTSRFRPRDASASEYGGDHDHDDSDEDWLVACAARGAVT